MRRANKRDEINKKARERRMEKKVTSDDVKTYNNKEAERRKKSRSAMPAEIRERVLQDRRERYSKLPPEQHATILKDRRDRYRNLDQEERASILQKRRRRYVELDKEKHENILKARRDRYRSMSTQQRTEYCLEQKEALRQRRKRYTPEINQAELDANKIRNKVTRNQGRRLNSEQQLRMRPFITRMNPEAPAGISKRENIRRKMIVAKFDNEKFQRKKAKASEEIEIYNRCFNNCATIQYRDKRERYLTHYSKRLKAATAIHDRASLLEEESKIRYASAVAEYTYGNGDEINKKAKERSMASFHQEGVLETPTTQSAAAINDDDFHVVNPVTGQYRTIEDDVPAHVNPKTGHYKYGVRKCSKCKQFKEKSHFTEEEANKAAAQRVCNICFASDATHTERNNCTSVVDAPRGSLEYQTYHLDRDVQKWLLENPYVYDREMERQKAAADSGDAIDVGYLDNLEDSGSYGSYCSDNCYDNDETGFRSPPNHAEEYAQYF